MSVPFSRAVPAIFAIVLLQFGCGSTTDSSVVTPPALVVGDLAPVSPTTGSGVVGAAASVIPRVLVTSTTGVAMKNVPVLFQVTLGGGTVSGGSTTTDENGLASPSSWILGTTVGINAMTATIESVPRVTFTLKSVAGAAALMTRGAGDMQVGAPASAVATRPAVHLTDAYGNPTAGVAVTFAVASGGGVITGATQITDSAGNATVGSWTLGPVAGTNALTVSAAGVTPVTFTATTIVGAAVRVTALAGEAQIGTPNTAVAIRPAVHVTDAAGNPVPGVLVVFEVATGGGAVTAPSQLTNTDGNATVGGWTLGAFAEDNVMSATIPGLTPVYFRVTAKASISVAPALAATRAKGTVAYAATVVGGFNQTAVWQVNGVTGGTATTGTISTAGVYTAPTTIPGDSVVITGVFPGDATVNQSVTLFFLPESVLPDYYFSIPRVVDVAQNTRTRFVFVPLAGTASMTFIPSSGSPVPMTSLGNGAFTFEMTAAAATAGYVNGRLHNYVGQLDYRSASGAQTKLTNLTVNVRDATMPNVAITPLASDAQRSAYILNVRRDTAFSQAYPGITARGLSLIGGDQYDFAAIIAPVISNNNRNYSGVRNDIAGIGASIFNNGLAWGGGSRLRGVVTFPIDGYFDGAEAGFIHEVGHSWINYAPTGVLAQGAPHWPASTLANGIMGFSVPGSSEGGNFPWAFIPAGNGMVTMQSSGNLNAFTPLDLYLMGLLPPDSVPPMYVLPPTIAASSFANGAVFPATTYTIADYIRERGPRVPSSSTAPKQFSMAIVIVSFGRLLSASEMAFFDNASARAETLIALQGQLGRSLDPGTGFYLATGGRATLRTRIP